MLETVGVPVNMLYTQPQGEGGMERPLPFGARTGADCTPPAPPGTPLPSESFPQRRLRAVTTLGRALGHGHPAPTSSFSGVLCLGLAPEGWRRNQKTPHLCP